MCTVYPAPIRIGCAQYVAECNPPLYRCTIGRWSKSHELACYYIIARYNSSNISDTDNQPIKGLRKYQYLPQIFITFNLA